MDVDFIVIPSRHAGVGIPWLEEKPIEKHLKAFGDCHTCDHGYRFAMTYFLNEYVNMLSALA